MQSCTSHPPAAPTPASPTEIRRLKRKEQNRLAQRRHREKARGYPFQGLDYIARRDIGAVFPSPEPEPEPEPDDDTSSAQGARTLKKIRTKPDLGLPPAVVDWAGPLVSSPTSMPSSASSSRPNQSKLSSTSSSRSTSPSAWPTVTTIPAAPFTVAPAIVGQSVPVSTSATSTSWIPEGSNLCMRPVAGPSSLEVATTLQGAEVQRGDLFNLWSGNGNPGQPLAAQPDLSSFRAWLSHDIVNASPPVPFCPPDDPLISRAVGDFGTSFVPPASAYDASSKPAPQHAHSTTVTNDASSTSTVQRFHPSTATSADAPTSQSPLHRFVTLVASNTPWIERMFGSGWDLLKVLTAASQRLGLMFQYIEADDSTSFLPMDFHGLKSSSSLVGRFDHAVEPALAVDPDKGPNRSLLRWGFLPDNMAPSNLSAVVAHHPFIDLSFPWPSVRDKILASIAFGLLDEVALCVDIWPGHEYQEQGADPPYWVHGDDPFDPEAYELSDRFATTFACLLDPLVIKRTNWWRRQQHKRELDPAVWATASVFAPFMAHMTAHLLRPLEVRPPYLDVHMTARLPPGKVRGKNFHGPEVVLPAANGDGFKVPFDPQQASRFAELSALHVAANAKQIHELAHTNDVADTLAPSIMSHSVL
ncbi:unnamed protein product [Parajaminaea phylloscopi]